MSRLTCYERETIINYNEAEAVAAEAVAVVYTHNKGLRRKLEQWAQERSEDCRLEKVTRFGAAVDYFIPKSWVHIYPPRQISEEQRAAMAERMKAAKLRQKTPTAQGDSDRAAAPKGKLHIPAPGSEKEA